MFVVPELIRWCSYVYVILSVEVPYCGGRLEGGSGSEKKDHIPDVEVFNIQTWTKVSLVN